MDWNQGCLFPERDRAVSACYTSGTFHLAELLFSSMQLSAPAASHLIQPDASLWGQMCVFLERGTAGIVRRPVSTVKTLLNRTQKAHKHSNRIQLLCSRCRQGVSGLQTLTLKTLSNTIKKSSVVHRAYAQSIRVSLSTVGLKKEPSCFLIYARTGLNDRFLDKSLPCQTNWHDVSSVHPPALSVSISIKSMYDTKK